MRLLYVGLVGALVISGCGGDGDGGVRDGGIVSAVTVFEPVDAERQTYLALPFPNDAYLDESGHVALGFPPGYAELLIRSAVELERRTAFCRICAVFFPVTGQLDPGSVPGDAAPDATASLDDPIVLLRADGEGGPVPLQVDYHHAEGLIVIRPRYGIVLDPGVRYVAALTDELRADDGTPLAPAPTFAALRDGLEVSVEGERVRPMAEDALAALEAAGVARERVVSATIFTTEGDVRLHREIAAVSESAAPPTLTVDSVRSGAELDILMGVPSEDRPGVDIPPAEGDGDRSVVHDAIDYVVTGTFTGPRIVGGSGGDIGLLLRDEDGVVTAGESTEQIPWVLLVPKGVDLAELPVVFVHHGNPGSMMYALWVGNAFAREGMAVFSYNMFQMAGRTADSEDVRNVLLDTEEPDGFLDTPDRTTIELRTLGLDGAAPGEEDRGDHYLGFEAQALLDVTMALRLLRESDLAPLGEADGALAGISLDPDQIYFVGQSFGAHLGLAALPLMAGEVQAALFAVGPPDFSEHSCSSPGNRGNTETLGMYVLGLRPPFEDEGRRLVMTPQMDLARWMMQPVAPVHTLHFALADPVRDGEPPDMLFYYADHDRSLGNSSGEHVLGVAGVPVRGNAYFAALPSLDGPLRGNLETASGSITAGGWIWEGTHGLLGFKNVKIRYETPLYPPFVALDEERAHANPIEDAYGVALHFFRTRRETGRAELVEPSSL